MSEQTLSTTVAWRRGFFIRFVLFGAIALGIVAIALGPRGLAQVSALAAATNWTPHAPRLDLLAAASPVIKVHLATVLLSLGLGAVQLLGPKGKTMHRVLGWTFTALMLTTAVATLFLHGPNGRFGPLHIFSAVVLISLPIGVIAARTHNVARHARVMTGLYIGGLLFAGVIAFLPGRLMWQMFFG